MQSLAAAGRTGFVAAYRSAAAQYWFGIFPRVRREARRWRERAVQIPDPVLRGHALEALETKRTNLDGAAAFALLAPRRYRGPAVRAEVVFALLSDYLDTLSEQPSEDPVANGLLL